MGNIIEKHFGILELGNLFKAETWLLLRDSLKIDVLELVNLKEISQFQNFKILISGSLSLIKRNTLYPYLNSLGTTV